MPDIDVPGTGVWVTVVNVVVDLLPAVPLPAASSSVPSAALMVEPSTTRVMVAEPGNELAKNSIAEVPSSEGVIVAAIFAPLESIA